MTVEYLTGDCREVLKTLPDKHFNTVVTSPPYWGLRDYQTDSQIGYRDSYEEYLQRLNKFSKIDIILKD